MLHTRLILLTTILGGCATGSDDDPTADSDPDTTADSEADTTGDSDSPADSDEGTTDSIGAEWAQFSENVTVYLDGDEIVIETNGLPDHTSPYWSPDHPLFVEPTVAAGLVPGHIDDFMGSYTLRVPQAPVRAANSTSTTLGPIGIARSGSMIYNDEEGGGRPVDNAAPNMDYTGAHTGPSSYHYHLETKAWSEDDDAIIGIMADGFFLYGRRCVTGEHPTDLDASGGHTSATPYNDDATYHYHIKNELYIGLYYLLFPGDFQGTPSSF